jgi:hypothetical protein
MFGRKETEDFSRKNNASVSITRDYTKGRRILEEKKDRMRLT